MKLPVPVREFRVRCPGFGFCKVRIFRTRAQVEQCWRAEQAPMKNYQRGETYAFYTTAPDRCFHFALDTNPFNIVPHECVHAVMDYMKRVTSADDELFATRVGQMSVTIIEEILRVKRLQTGRSSHEASLKGNRG